MPQPFAERDRAGIDKKNAKAVSFLLFFQNFLIFKFNLIQLIVAFESFDNIFVIDCTEC